MDSRFSARRTGRGEPPRPATLAAQVVAEAETGTAADLALRKALDSWKGYPSADRREAARRVFAYFRWRGWLDLDAGIPTRIDDALRLAGNWARRPGEFSPALLLARAVPPWVPSEVSASPEWAASLQDEPTVWIRTRREEFESVRASLHGEPMSELPGALRYSGELDLFSTTEFQEGRFELQDVASQWVGILSLPQPGETWWDACAGEGGKTLHLSDLMQNKGLIWASDRSVRRLEVLKKRAARAKCFNYRAAEWDGGPKLPTKTKFDGVLVDAPCSGMGTWGRNPHARWTTTPGDVSELSEVQLRLLKNVSGSVKPGGRIIYSVCTMARKETTDVARRFEAAHPELERLILPQPGLPGETGPEVWIHPHVWKSNGMFIAGWRRK